MQYLSAMGYMGGASVPLSSIARGLPTWSSLRSGGLLPEGYRPEQLLYGRGDPSKSANLYTEALMGEVFAPLQILQLESYGACVEEARNHACMAPLIGLVARRPA